MPELPEVETVMRGIEPAMTGYRIDQLILNRPDLRWPFPGSMAERVSGAKVLGLRRRSKYILADLDSNETLLIHLGMSGRILVSGDPLGNFVREHPPIEKHDHVIFSMENGARITFNDPRRFGAMDLLDTALGDAHPLLCNIGPEPFGNDGPNRRLVSCAGRGAPAGRDVGPARGRSRDSFPGGSFGEAVDFSRRPLSSLLELGL